ncbi:CCA tRNA nucleotidyltransferase [Agrilactobacillus yilanensis]|uniref:CCA-adding enzyme n=1 Tax=Agrilactobacillus yilanensis TaxID=2485997 RepID=A0ABW4J7F9_9LACO|nr:CCA tRNA nucleotidyltransferase [Agrilactobacillus yilanensis]
MKLTQLPQDFQVAQPILETIEAAGFEAYFVGGAVRDALLKRPIHDVDIATSAYPAEVKALFKRTVDTGIKHGTVTILDHGAGYEVTTFRTESTYQDYRRPDKVTFVRSLDEDLKRRDFTINALAMKADGTIIDLFDGLADMQQQRLRAVGKPFERFHEDALRMMRAVRFEAQLDFSLEANTKAAITSNHQLLTKIAIERIHSEFLKMMLSPHWATGLQTFIETKLATAVPLFLPYQAQLKQALAYDGVFANETQVWVFLAWNLGLTPDKLKKGLKTWKTANQVINQSELTLQLCLTLQKQPADIDWVLYQSGAQAVRDGLAVLRQVNRIDSAQQQHLQQIYDTLPIHCAQDLAVNGRDLMAAGLTPGPKIGQSLQQLQRQVVAGKVANQPKALLAILQN